MKKPPWIQSLHAHAIVEKLNEQTVFATWVWSWSHSLKMETPRSENSKEIEILEFFFACCVTL